jgi:hypothetical protein
LSQEDFTMNANVRFAVSPQADPLVHAYQAARLALVHREAGRIPGLKADLPVPTLLLVTGAEEAMAQLLAALEAAQVFAAVEVEVDAENDQAVQDFAEHLRDRSDNVVVVARRADPGPAA